MARFGHEELDAIISPLRWRVEALMQALTPSSETKAAYLGEFTEWGCDECGDVTISWGTIQEIMRFIREYALAIEAEREQAEKGVE